LILYLDTSALVKLYAKERGREEVQSTVQEARVVAISELGFVEACSALARKEREGFFSEDEHNDAVEFLKRDFREVYLPRPVTGEIITRAGELAREHALRAYDAVHLATALTLRDEARELAMAQEEEPTEAPPLWESDDFQLLVLAYDHSLIKAVRQEGFAYRGEDPPHSHTDH
jgi:predicted nucleic acid-binding protein